MTRVLIATTVVALAAAVIGGPAGASALKDRPAINYQVPVHAARAQPAPWHYEWQYRFNRWGQYVPGRVAVFNK